MASGYDDCQAAYRHCIAWHEKHAAHTTLDSTRPLWYGRSQHIALVESVSAGGVAWAPARMDHTMEAFERGIDLERKGAYQDAIAAFQEAAQVDSPPPGTWMHLGVMLQYVGQVAESLDALERATQVDPRDAYAWEAKARSLQLLGRGCEALAPATNALSINPNLADAHYLRGLALADCSDGPGNAQAILTEYREAFRLQPNHVMALGDAALLLVMIMNLYDEGIKVASQALQYDQRSVKAWRAIALAHFGKREYYPALQAADHALATDPNDLLTWVIKGSVLRDLVPVERNVNRADEAIDCFDHALAIDPSDEIAQQCKQETVATRDKIRGRMRMNTAKGIINDIMGW